MVRFLITRPIATIMTYVAILTLGLVAAGLGVSILPASFKRVQLYEMCWIPIAEEDAVSEMWLVWPKHHEQSHAAQRFREQLLVAVQSG